MKNRKCTFVKINASIDVFLNLSRMGIKHFHEETFFHKAKTSGMTYCK
jgi:hypothetical protein